jgi:hypothetical protein
MLGRGLSLNVNVLWPVPVIGVNENHTYRKTALRRKANDIRLTRL